MVVRVMSIEAHVGNACKCFCNLIELTLGFLYEEDVILVGLGVVVEVEDFVMSATQGGSRLCRFDSIFGEHG